MNSHPLIGCHNFSIDTFSSTGLYKHAYSLPDDYSLICRKAIISYLHSFSFENFSCFDHTSFDSQSFHDALLAFRINQPSAFGALYDSLQSSIVLKKLASSDFFTSIASQLLSCDLESLVLRNTIIRFDAPQDTRNSVDWHFDVFADSNHYPRHGLTVVVPLTSYSTHNGAPICCISSHLTKATQHYSANSTSNTSESYHLNSEFTQKFEHFTLESPPGSVWAFPMNLVHKSGYNYSSMFRISILFRYYDLSSESFVPLAESYLPISL